MNDENYLVICEDCGRLTGKETRCPILAAEGIQVTVFLCDGCYKEREQEQDDE